MAAGAVLRLTGLSRNGLFYDESWSWAFAESPLSRFLPLAVSDVHPPLYYLLLKAWLVVVPTTETTLRIPSALLSVAALGLLAWFVR
ncbi:MAG: hypothetical protein KC729_15005, partial [Candidatus Eisenbacteria bacterium]|nr:hypothetical protein [Candidatus Eisenbacteria bacterium]